MRRRDDVLLRLLLHAYPDRVTVRRAADPTRGVMVGGRGVVLEPSSLLRAAPSPLFLSVDPRDPPAGGESRVSLASAVKGEWLEETHPHLVERRIVHRVDANQGKVVSVRETRFADLLVREDAVGPKADPEGAHRALFEHLRTDPDGFLKSDESSAAYLARLRFLSHHAPDPGFPLLDREALETILREACSGCLSIDAVRKKGLRRFLERRLTRAQRAAVDQHAPEAIKVPSGSRIRLQYSEDPAASPVLAVRLQEIFGWGESPRVARGRVPVLLHLLGPNFRPVQVTSDLQSFWDRTYPEVRKDLRARYPRHPWPEDPRKAAPVAVGGKRKR